VVRELEGAYLELTRPPGESAERVRVSATGGELAVHIRGALDQDVARRTLPQKPGAEGRKPSSHKEKEQGSKPRQ